tara:strand:- start:2394 stop:4226 length:1833 start_codon:yes stop_codon:yes gene_type:complete
VIKELPTIVSIYPLPFDIQFRHEANISIFHQGNFFAYEESKLVEDKEYAASVFPDKSFFCGLLQLELIPSDVDIWIFPSPSSKFDFQSLFSLFIYYKVLPVDVDSLETFKNWSDKHIVFIPHHNMHSGLGCLLNESNNFLSVTQDGGGDFGDPADLVVHLYESGNHKRLYQTNNYFNAANFHAGIAEILSFRENGKVSGLSAYGDEKAEILTILNSQLLRSSKLFHYKKERKSRTQPVPKRLNLDSFDKYKLLNPSPGHLELRDQLKGFMPQDIACTSEKFISSTYIEFLKKLLSEKVFESLNSSLTSSSLPIFFSGGFFNNVLLNREIVNNFSSSNKCLFGMAPGDCGLSLGAIGHYLYTSTRVRTEEFLILSPMLGPSFSSSSIKDLLDSVHLKYLSFDSFEKTCLKAANLISEGSIIGFFQGRAEYGPRSLGGRSILADPRRLSSKSRLNQLAKRRDWFMPFAPAIIDSYINLYVENPDFANPFMQIATYMTAQAKKDIPAAVHCDGTSRVQMVTEKTSLEFYLLLNKFYELTNVPCLLNTSFNRHGISTISTPRQAIEHLLFSNIDYLVIDNFIVGRSENLTDSYILHSNATLSESEQLKRLRPIQ